MCVCDGIYKEYKPKIIIKDYNCVPSNPVRRPPKTVARIPGADMENTGYVYIRPLLSVFTTSGTTSGTTTGTTTCTTTSVAGVAFSKADSSISPIGWRGGGGRMI